MHACMRACMHACVRACVCMHEGVRVCVHAGRRKVLVFQQLHSSRKRPFGWPERSTTTLGRNIDRTERNTEPTEPIFGRTDLRKGVSEAKFDAEADFDVKKYLAPPRSPGNHEKPKKNRKIFRKKILASKNRKLQIVRNAFSRSFAAIGAKFEG